MGGFYEVDLGVVGMKRTAVGAGLLVALLAVAVVGVGGVAAQDDGENATATNASLGTEISSFMQASSAEAEGEVDDGMFDAALDRTDDPAERRTLVERRQQRLQERQARLEDRRASLSDGNATDAPGVREHALATHVTVGATELEQSVNGTERAAQAAGLDTEALAEIRSSARELRGPEVAELARNLAGQAPGVSDGPLSDAPGVNRTEVRGPPGQADPSDGAADGARDVDDGTDRESNPGGSDDRPADGGAEEDDETPAETDG